MSAHHQLQRQLLCVIIVLPVTVCCGGAACCFGAQILGLHCACFRQSQWKTVRWSQISFGQVIKTPINLFHFYKDGSLTFQNFNKLERLLWIQNHKFLQHYMKWRSISNTSNTLKAHVEVVIKILNLPMRCLALACFSVASRTCGRYMYVLVL